MEGSWITGNSFESSRDAGGFTPIRPFEDVGNPPRDKSPPPPPPPPTPLSTNTANKADPGMKDKIMEALSGKM